MRLLVVDFDFFFPQNDAWDWHVKENAFYIEAIWELRAEYFVRNKLTLPKTTGQEKDFWSKWDLSNVPLVMYSESNCYSGVIPYRDSITEVVLVDTHHDSGYRGSIKSIIEHDEVTCENWMYMYRNVPRLWVYPDHLEDADDQNSDIPIDRVRWSEYDASSYRPDIIHICRSGAWVPPWCDSSFIEFVNSLSVHPKFDLDRMDSSSKWRAMRKRQFSIKRVRAMVKVQREAMEKFKETFKELQGAELLLQSRDKINS